MKEVTRDTLSDMLAKLNQARNQRRQSKVPTADARWRELVGDRLDRMEQRLVELERTIDQLLRNLGSAHGKPN